MHLSSHEIERQVRSLGQWFHNIDLRGVQTAPDHLLGDYPTIKWQRFAHAIPEDLSGKSVLDVGCNGGFYSIEMKRRGAARVVAIDQSDDHLRQAEFAARVSGYPDVEFRNMSVYDVARLGERFDVVIFTGALYHLRHPLLALDALYDHAVGDMLLFQSLERGSRDAAPAGDDAFSASSVFEQDGYPLMYFVERGDAGDPTSWWIPNRACVEAMLRSAGFSIEQQPEDDVYICRRGERPSPADA